MLNETAGIVWLKICKYKVRKRLISKILSVYIQITLDDHLFLSKNQIKNRFSLQEKSMESTTGLIVKIVCPLLVIIVSILGLIYSCRKDDRKDTETVGKDTTMA